MGCGDAGDVWVLGSGGTEVKEGGFGEGAAAVTEEDDDGGFVGGEGKLGGGRGEGADCWGGGDWD